MKKEKITAQNLGINQVEVLEKSRIIGTVLDGLTIPVAISILGTVIVELVTNAKEQGYDLRKFFANWLKNMSTTINTLDYCEIDKEKERPIVN